MKTLNPEHLAAVRERINNCPYFRLLSMNVLELSFGHARLEAQVEEKHLQAFGFVHGGTLASIIDTTAFWSAYCDLDEDAGMTTVDLKLNYLAPVKKGMLSAKGNCLKMGKTLGLGEAEVRNEDGKLIAQGTSTLIVLPGLKLAGLPELPPKFIG